MYDKGVPEYTVTLYWLGYKNNRLSEMGRLFPFMAILLNHNLYDFTEDKY